MNTALASESRATPCRPRVLLLGPGLDAVSGVSTHLNELFRSALSDCCALSQFRVGSEGRAETRLGAQLRLARSPIELALCVMRRRAQIVHLNTSLDRKAYWRDLAYLTVAKLLGRKVVYQIHGGALPQEFFAGRRAPMALLRRVLASAETVVVLTRTELASYREFAPAACVERIANAVEVPDADLRAARYETGCLEIVYLGRLAEDKGIFDALRALALLRDRGIEARLSIAGSGPAERQLREAIEASKLGGCTRLLGTVRGAEKQRLWQQGHVFVFPSYREGLPYALLESMAAGTVPITTRVGGIPDVLEDGVHGLFVPPRDPRAIAEALERLDRDRAGLHRMALAGRQRIIEHYSVARLAADLQRLYFRLVLS